MPREKGRVSSCKHDIWTNKCFFNVHNPFARSSALEQKADILNSEELDFPF